jgi:hypothetical protein
MQVIWLAPLISIKGQSFLRHLGKYRTDWHNHVVALLGKHSAFRGLVDSYADFGQAGHSDGPGDAETLAA